MTVVFSVIIVICILLAETKKEKKIQNELYNAKIVRSIMPYGALCEINNGGLPIICQSNINYYPNERCHYSENATCFLESRITSYQRSTNGIYTKSKNVGRRTNISTTYPVTMTKTEIYQGTLVVTNERIIFINDDYSLCIPLCCIVSFTPYNNRIVINSGKRIDSIYVPNGFIISNLLNSICNERNKI